VRRALALLALAGGAALGACGGSGSSATSASVPATTAKTLTTPLKINTNPTTVPTQVNTSTVTTGTTPTTTTGSGGAGAGDEQPIRVPATYTFSAGGLKPSTISVPAFLTIALTVVSADGKAHDVTVQTDHGAKSLHVTAGGRASSVLTGMKRGTYDVSGDGGAATAKLVVGVEPGP
jgi:hypothetical protein